MTFRSDFVASPETFMESHIVTPQFYDGVAPPRESRPAVVTIKELEDRRCSKRGGRVFHLSFDTRGVSRDEKLPIYWLAYKRNDFTQGRLNNQSRYMFTALMNGCTLGFGSQAGDGNCLVSHANNATAGADGRQAEAQRDQLRERFAGQSFGMLEPNAYRATSHGDATFDATNFGKNVDGTWQFFTLKFKRIGSAQTYLHGGVEPAVTIPPR